MVDKTRNLSDKQLAAGGGIVLTACLTMLALLFIIPLILMVAWNAVIPPAFNGPTLNYPEAFALYVVASTLLNLVRR